MEDAQRIDAAHVPGAAARKGLMLRRRGVAVGMLGGLPVLTCLGGQLQTMLRQHGCGLFWNEGDAAGLADAINRLIGDPEARQRMADNAAFAYSENFVAQVVYGNLIDHLCSLAAAPRTDSTTATGLAPQLQPTP